MKDKNTIIGWVLIGLVFIGYMIYSGKNQEKQAEYARQKHELDSIKAIQDRAKFVADSTARAAELQAEQSDSTNEFFAARQGQESTIVLENNLLKLNISTKGGQISRAELLDEAYKSRDPENEHVVLFDEKDIKMDFLFNGKNKNIRFSDFFLQAKEVKQDSAGKTNSVTMSLPYGGNGSLDITYSLIPNSYIVNVDLKANNMSDFFNADTKTMTIDWSQHIRQQEKGFAFENRYSTITYRDTENDTDELSSAGSNVEETGEDLDFKMRWVAFKTQFFSQILMADGSFGPTLMYSNMEKEEIQKGTKYLKWLRTTIDSKFDPSGQGVTRMHMYLGPNKFSTLKDNEAILDEMVGEETDFDLQSIVYLGWPIVRWINRFVFLPIFDFMTQWGLNMGIVLILITLIVKFCVYPLMKKSYLSSAKMRVLKPRMEELNKKYPNKEDAMMKNQEMMQIYQEYGVSPMGGCLPMLIQMPIWIALFNFIPNAIELRGHSFLWADDLSAYDDVIQFGSNIWGIGNHLSLFCILWCVSTWINTWISMSQQSYNAAMSPEQQQSMGCMKWFSYLMPLIFFFSFNSYSSGLNLYYFVSGLLSILMMWYLRATTDDAKLLAYLEERKKARKANPKKTMSMMERLQAMAEQQRALQEQQKRNKQK